MKKTVLIQSVPHFPTAWGDASNAWNQGSYFTGMAVWHTREFTQKLGIWTKQSYNLIIDKHPEDDYKLVIKKAGSNYDKFQDITLSCEVDLRVAFDYLDKNPKTKSCAFGYACKGSLPPSTDVLENSVWFTRKTLGKSVFDNEDDIIRDVNARLVTLPELEYMSPTDEKVMGTLVWFFIYRTEEVPIYYIIPNPDLMGIAPQIEKSYDDIRYRVIDAHFGTIGDLIFRPKFSKNVMMLAPNKLLVQEDFEIYPFENGVFGWGYQEEFPKVNIKVTTDLILERNPDNNKLKFKFKEGRDRGFVNLRWNSSSVLDLSMSSHDSNYVQNKCQYTFDVYRKL